MVCQSAREIGILFKFIHCIVDRYSMYKTKVGITKSQQWLIEIIGMNYNGVTSEVWAWALDSYTYVCRWYFSWRKKIIIFNCFQLLNSVVLQRGVICALYDYLSSKHRMKKIVVNWHHFWHSAKKQEKRYSPDRGTKHTNRHAYGLTSKQ